MFGLDADARFEISWFLQENVLETVLVLLGLGPGGYLITGQYFCLYWTGCMLLPTLLVVLASAPVYAGLTILPLIYLIDHTLDTQGDSNPHTILWIALWFFLWSLYPLFRKRTEYWTPPWRAKKQRRLALIEEKAEQERLKEQQRQREREEQAERNAILEERAAADLEFGMTGPGFADLVESSGLQIVEMGRASKALGSGDCEDARATQIIDRDVAKILSVVANAKGEVPSSLGRLYQAVYARLDPENTFHLERHRSFLEDRRHKIQSAGLPLTIALLRLYDTVQGTHLAARAARAYWGLVVAACKVMDDGSGVAIKIVQARYLELLRSDLSNNDGEGSGPEVPNPEIPEPETGGFTRCGECPRFYGILRVAADATREEIKTAFRSLAKIYHSDRHHGQDDEVRRTADDLFVDLKQAYDHISSHWGP